MEFLLVCNQRANRGRMKELYKEHYIQSGAEPVPGSAEWKPIVEICWVEGAMDFMQRWTSCDFTRSCATEKLAEIEAHLFAREWIDGGKTTAPPRD
jgi:hypothetical protein